MARVSAIIPVYNGAVTIAEAIDSVLGQTYANSEVIVVNDGSTDATAEVLRQYGDRITVVEQTNGGLSKARNAALRIANGEYVAFLDADDLWLSTMLERAVAVLDRDQECVLVYSDLELVDSAGITLNTSLVGGPAAHAPTLEEMLTRLWPIMPSAVVMRRETLEECGGFCEEFRSYGYEDAYCWLRAREHGHFHYLPEKLAVWRFSLFPRQLKKTQGGAESARVFDRLLRERYGVPAAPLLKSRRRAARSILGYIGLSAMRDGDTARARAAFERALKLDPFRIKNYLRMVRTYLPSRIARALSGRTGRQACTPRE
jgi:glycosyltransferase involved in cell wall biosynthesis